MKDEHIIELKKAIRRLSEPPTIEQRLEALEYVTRRLFETERIVTESHLTKEKVK